jgi:iron complex transport system substrate-binding protein
MPRWAAHGPRRIVALTEEPTEILYALGEQDRLVGISAYTERPADAKATKPVVSAFVGGSVERITALKPDLVIGFSDIQANLAKELISANLAVLIFNQRTLNEILDVVITLGRIVGAHARAQTLVDGYIAGLDAASDRAAARAHQPRVYFEEWDDPMISAIRWVSELIELAGGTDVFADRSTGGHAKERIVTVDDVRAADPEVLLASWCGKPFDIQATTGRLAGTTAVTTGRMHEIDPCVILQPGPAALTAGLSALEQAIHPEPP